MLSLTPSALAALYRLTPQCRGGAKHFAVVIFFFFLSSFLITPMSLETSLTPGSVVRVFFSLSSTVAPSLFFLPSVASLNYSRNRMTSIFPTRSLKIELILLPEPPAPHSLMLMTPPWPTWPPTLPMPPPPPRLPHFLTTDIYTSV